MTYKRKKNDNIWSFTDDLVLACLPTFIFYIKDVFKYTQTSIDVAINDFSITYYSNFLNIQENKLIHNMSVLFYSSSNKLTITNERFSYKNKIN